MPRQHIDNTNKAGSAAPDADFSLRWSAVVRMIFSQKTFSHPAAPGDVVTVTRIDRLARSTFDLFGMVKRIVDAKTQFRFLAEPWADTGTSTGRLMLAVLGRLGRC